MLLLFHTLTAAIPALSAGPDLAERAALLVAPVAEVTVYSDRARIHRRAAVDVPAGGGAFRFPDLPGGALVDSIRVRTDRGTVLHVEAAPIDRERVSIDQADEALDQIETLTDQIAMLEAERTVLGLEVALLAALQPAPPVPEAQREGRPLPSIEPAIFRRAVEFLAQEQIRARERQRTIDVERRGKLEALASAQRQVQNLDLGGFTDRKIQVLVLIGAEAKSKCNLELEYFVPGALWRPSYDLRFFPDQAKVVVETTASVEQATGESWDGVELSLSTAIPGQSIALPELLTWTLGEAKDMIPTPRPRTAPPTIGLHPPPVPSATAAELERQAHRALLASRLARLGQIAEAAPSELVYEKKTVVNFDEDQVGGELASPDVAYIEPRKRQSARGGSGATKSMPPPPSAPAMDDGASYGYAREEVMAEAEASSSSRRSGAGEGTHMSLALFEAPPPPRIEFSDRSLPAMIAGGLDYVYLSPSRVSVPSTGAKVRVPLATDRYPVSTYYEATPSLAEHAFLKATVENKSKRPMLQGPINIFVNDAFAGEAEMKTTGPGGKIELPLGADEDIRFKRRVIAKTTREGVFSKSDITTYQVVIEVGNYKARAVRVAVTEVVPKTSHEDIEVELMKIDPKPQAGPDGEGIFRYSVEVPPGKTKTLTLEYKVERPANWQLYQP